MWIAAAAAANNLSTKYEVSGHSAKGGENASRSGIFLSFQLLFSLLYLGCLCCLY